MMNISEFNSKEHPIIRFGRKKTSDYTINACFNEESTSRLNCTITYDALQKSWTIIDSNGYKESLNGTWYLADDKVVVFDKMSIRAGTSTFACNLISIKP